MRRDWDERARRNVFRYIASWRNDWDEASFFESGEQDYLRLVDPILQKFHFEPASRSMVELGCGAGRMTRSFAERFHSVSAVDISAEMQSRYYASSPYNLARVIRGRIQADDDAQDNVYLRAARCFRECESQLRSERTSCLPRSPAERPGPKPRPA